MDHSGSVVFPAFFHTSTVGNFSTVPDNVHSRLKRRKIILKNRLKVTSVAVEGRPIDWYILMDNGVV